MPKLLHCSRHVLLCQGELLSQSYTLLFLSYGCRRFYSLKWLVVCLRERVVVILLIITQLQTGLICIFVDFLVDRGGFVSTKKSLECADVVIGMVVSVLELVDVPDARKVLFIDVFLHLKRTHPLKNSLIRFIDFHNLNLLNTIIIEQYKIFASPTLKNYNIFVPITFFALL